MIAIAMLLAVTAASAARGQSVNSDSTGFRAGQWGAEFSLGGGNGIASGVGALRFFSGRRALLFDVNGRLLRETGDAQLERTESAMIGEVGGSWMVSSQLSLGASWQGAVQYARSTQDGRTLSPTMIVPATRANAWSVSVGTLALRAGVYF